MRRQPPRPRRKAGDLALKPVLVDAQVAEQSGDDRQMRAPRNEPAEWKSSGPPSAVAPSVMRHVGDQDGTPGQQRARGPAT